MATESTIQALVGGNAAAKVLLFIENYTEGYARQIARTFDISLNEIQKQLSKFEEAGILVSRMVGNSRMYTWNPRDPALQGLRQLLRDTLESGIPETTLKRFYRQRQRPRRKGKPL
ncbi:MAG: winged helix-turn-helix domain-containing protein [Gammaproteobacteria bacterium]|nr:winged helix-turn-helix domain-containing protein [Gammaproteobacteria bacterium]